MPHVITSHCVGTCDTACAQACPVECIHGPIAQTTLRSVPAGERGVRFPGVQLYIDPDECIDCSCCVPVCPVSAIHMDCDVPLELRGDIEANARFFGRRGR